MSAGAASIEASKPQSAWRRGASIVVLAAIAAILGAMLHDRAAIDGWTLLHWVGKPLATFTLAVLVAHHSPQAPRKLRNAVLAGLGCSLVGDVLLMLSPGLFVAGLVAFLVAHLCYLRAFTFDTRRFGDRRALVVLAAIGAGVLALLWGSLPAALKVPVLAYVVVIVAMASQAWARRRAHPSHATSTAAIGATLFVASDALLAIDRFRAPIPLAALWVLGTYWLAQWGIAQSARPSSSADTPFSPGKRRCR